MPDSARQLNEQWIDAVDEQGVAVRVRILGPRRGRTTVVTLANGRRLMVRGRGVLQAVGDGMVYKCDERESL